jgi:transposase
MESARLYRLTPDRHASCSGSGGRHRRAPWSFRPARLTRSPQRRVTLQTRRSAVIFGIAASSDFDFAGQLGLIRVVNLGAHRLAEGGCDDGIRRASASAGANSARAEWMLWMPPRRPYGSPRWRTVVVRDDVHGGFDLARGAAQPALAREGFGIETVAVDVTRGERIQNLARSRYALFYRCGCPCCALEFAAGFGHAVRLPLAGHAVKKCWRIWFY